MTWKDRLYKYSPSWLKDILVSIYNYKESRFRYGKAYYSMRAFVRQHEYSDRETLLAIQNDAFMELFRHAISTSVFYKKFYSDVKVEDIDDIGDIKKLPILTKHLLQQNIEDNICVPLKDAWVIKTGGTTGKSMQVYGTIDDASRRIALLDEFRARFGFEKGAKVAWFSGKDILSSGDVKRKRFWRTDYLKKVRYYSTFHIDRFSVEYYLDDLERFKPDFIVGFPSSLLDITRLANILNLSFDHVPTCIFPTAETLTPVMRDSLADFYNCPVQDQYAASEGVPIITTCEKGHYHIELLAGVFEVLDENDNDSLTGRLVVSGFDTKGCPLIRYDVGDVVELYPETEYCSCGRKTPIAKRILGRVDDYLESYSGRRINLGNISNCLKDVKGVRAFQIVQSLRTEIDVLIETMPDVYTKDDELCFLENIYSRFEREMAVNVKYVSKIPLEASGKFRMIKNLMRKDG